MILKGSLILNNKFEEYTALLDEVNLSFRISINSPHSISMRQFTYKLDFNKVKNKIDEQNYIRIFKQEIRGAIKAKYSNT